MNKRETTIHPPGRPPHPDQGIQDNIHGNSTLTEWRGAQSKQRVTRGTFTIMLEAGPLRESLDAEIIEQALDNPVYVLDAGNCFNPLRLTRLIRRHTIQVRRTLDHIQVARSFTCFQLISLLEKTLSPDGPVYILRPLTSFSDELASITDRLRLLRQVEGHIDRLRSSVPVTVMIRNANLQDETQLEWFQKLQLRADKTIFPQVEVQSQPPTLF